MGSRDLGLTEGNSDEGWKDGLTDGSADGDLRG